jgi:GNAT superfamily N-acetyltransferase
MHHLRAQYGRVGLVRGSETQPLNIQVYNAQGAWVGGILAATYWGWVVIDVLAVVEEARSQGIGTALMAQVEAEARARGCTRAHTSTYAHQALGFYLRLGYRIVGQMADYPEGFTYYWLQKGL